MAAFGSVGEAGSVADKHVYFQLSADCGLWYRGLPRMANGMEGWSVCRLRGNAAFYHDPQVHSGLKYTTLPAGQANSPLVARGSLSSHELCARDLETDTASCLKGAQKSAARGRIKVQHWGALYHKPSAHSPRKRARRTTSKGRPKVQHGGLIHPTPQGFPPPS